MTLTVLHIVPADGIAAANQIQLLREFGSGEIVHESLMVSGGSGGNRTTSEANDSVFQFRFPVLDRIRFSSLVGNSNADIVHVWPLASSLAAWVGSGLGSQRTVASFTGNAKRIPRSLVRRADRVTTPLKCLASRLAERVKCEVRWLAPPIRDQNIGLQINRDTSFPAVATHSSFTYDECLKEMLWAGSMLEQLGPFRIHIAGNAPLRTALEDYASQIHVYGDTANFITEHDVEAPFIGINCYWSTARHSCFRYGMLTALGCGLPVIAMENDAHRELLTEEGLRCGELIEGSSVAFAKTTLRLLENSDRYARFQEAAVEHVRKHFLASQVVSAYEDFYRSL